MLQPSGETAIGIALPRVLSPADIARYRKIMALQEDGQWKRADAEIRKLEAPILMGHVMAQRYLHPTKYRSRYNELRDWLADYADHPQARRIHKLALRRKPRAAAAPRAPVAEHFPTAATSGQSRDHRPPRRAMSTTERRQAARVMSRITNSLRNGWTLAAKRTIQEPKTSKLLDPFDFDRAQGMLGIRYFFDGRDEWALEWTGRATVRWGKYLPETHWAAGLAAWRLNRLDDAARHFAAVAKSPNSSSWMISAGAFWAARAHLLNREPAEVNHWLARAAAYPRTFYGLLARRIRGTPIRFDWSLPEADTAALESLLDGATGQRTLALLEVGENELAERELRGLAGRVEAQKLRGLLAFTVATEMPALSVRLNHLLFADGTGFDAADYPTARWAPKDGFRIDRALIYALIRQESQFNPNAKSWAGARGLMQIMPRTASFVAGDRRLRGSQRHLLYDPERNLELGQRYIEILLNENGIGNDLFALATAWNGGPGNFGKWRRATDGAEDPLFFIESIPSRETRIFIERVLTNLWIYRSRFGQPTPSLDALAAGERPAYVALDNETLSVASRDRN